MDDLSQMMDFGPAQSKHTGQNKVEGDDPLMLPWIKYPHLCVVCITLHSHSFQTFSFLGSHM